MSETADEERREGDRSLGALPDPGLRRSWRWIILAIGAVACLALIMAPILFYLVTAERSKRIDTVSQIIAQGCGTDNSQDQLLAGLLDASLDQQVFGEGIDPATLDPFTADVLASIQKVTRLAKEQNPGTIQAFRKALAELSDLANCAALVAAYRAGSDVTDVETGQPVTKSPNAPEQVGEAVAQGIGKK